MTMTASTDTRDGRRPRLAPTAAALRRPRPAPRWWADAIGLTAIGNLAFVVWLWVHHGNARALIEPTGLGGALTAAGQLTGLVASDLMLMQIVLMARVPWLERSWGHDRLARRHRVFGFWSFWAMCAHVALIVPGYALASGPGTLRGIVLTGVGMVLTYPGMLLATAGTALLVLVVVTSIRAARRRTRYESWHLLHLYAYLGVGLALPHQLWAGSDFTASAPATVYWWTAWAVAAGAVLLFRVALPLIRSARLGLRVVEVVREGPDTVSVVMTGRGLPWLRVAPGQFFVWRFLDGPGWTRGHPLSLSAAPDGRTLRVTARVVGDGTARLARLRPGTRVLVEGPYGNLTWRDAPRPALLVASGIGVTPLRALLEERRLPRGSAVLYRVRSAEDAPLLTELDAIARARGHYVVPLPGHRAGPHAWHPAGLPGRNGADVLRRIVPDVAHRELYVCGPRPWMAAVVRAARRAGVPARRVHVEDFAL